MTIKEVVDNFCNNSLLLIEEWKNVSEDIINKNKILKENQTSIEILEKNLGNINVDHLKYIITTQSENLKDKLTLQSNLEDNLKKTVQIVM